MSICNDSDIAEINKDLTRMTSLISRLIDIMECHNGKRFPEVKMEDRAELMSREIERLIDDLQSDENLVIC